MRPFLTTVILLIATTTFAQLETIDLTGKIKKAYYLDYSDQLCKKGEAHYIVTFTPTADPTIVHFEKNTLAGYVRLSGDFLIGTPNKRHGKFTTYYEGQKIHKEEHYHNDVLEGLSKIYATNGNLSSEGTYVGGKKHGTWTEYMVDGSYFQGDYVNGDKEGPWKKYRNRALQYTEQYRFGRAIGQANVNSSEIAIVCKKKKDDKPYSFYYGCINMDGKEVVPLEYDGIEKVTRNKELKVRKDGKAGILSYGGVVRIPIEYDWIYRYGSYTYIVSKDGKQGIISRDNKVVIPIEYEDLGEEDSSGLIKAKKNGKWGFINIKNEVKIKFKYDKACNFGRDFAYVKLGSSWLALDREGNLKPVENDDDECWEDIPEVMMVDDYSDNFDRNMRTEGKQKFKLIVFKGSSGKAVLDEYGNFVIPEEFQDIKWYMNGRICVQNKEGKWGFYNDLGEEVIPCKYDKVYPFGDLN